MSYEHMRACRTATLLVLLLGIAATSGSASPSRHFPMNVGPNAYLPGQHVLLAYVDPASPVATIYKLPVERVDTFENTPHSDEVFASLTRVAEVRFGSPDQNEVSTADAGVLPAGYYVAVVGNAGARNWWRFSVTSFGLSTATFTDATVVWPVDLRTLNGFKQKIDIRLASPDGLRQVQPRADGVAIVASEPSGRSGSVIVATAPDGSVQVVRRRYDYNRGRDLSAYVETDRPIYRPGQTVYFHAIVRMGFVGAYEIPRNSLRVQITSQRDRRVLYDKRLRLSSYGTLAGSLRLPQEALLDSYSISVGEDGYTAGGEFSVVDYKKPEATLHLSTLRPWAVSGDDLTIHTSASYLFGRPAAGMRLHYFVGFLDGQQSFYRQTRDPYAWVGTLVGASRDAEVAQGDGVAGPEGDFDVTFPVPTATNSGELVTTVLATDTSGRTIVARLGTTVHSAAFDVSVAPERWIIEAGRNARVRVQTRNDDGTLRPNQAVLLALTRVSWSAKRKAYDELETQQRRVVTDAAGNAVVDWMPPAEGMYRITASGNDDRSRTASGVAYLTAYSNAGAGEPLVPSQRVQLIPEKPVLAPGEHGRVLVLLPVADRDIEITTSTDRLQSVRILHVSGNATAIDVLPPRDASTYVVGATLPSATGGTADFTVLTVNPAPRKLTVRITPDKKRYVPGETARLRVAVADAGGRPVRSQVAVGVVDEAIYALHFDYRRPFEYFYERANWDDGRGDWDLTTKVPSRELHTIAHVSARASIYPSAQSDSRSSVRANFLDTAFWSPDVVTDVSGRATVAFRWPDDLTTWRATGIAVTTQTGVGLSSADALVTKDFLVRLATPRFLRIGDSATIAGIAHGVPQSSTVTLRLDAAPLASATPQAVHLGADSSATATWPVAAQSIGAASLALYGSDGMRSDAVRTTLPIEGATSEEHLVQGGQDSAQVRLSVPPGYGAGNAVVTLAPSALSELMRGLHLLEVYPYDCTEQTISAALPALFVERYLRRENATSEDAIHAESVAMKASDRLRELRHRDGSYGWWENDPPHPFMTAYALYALAEFKRQGWPEYIDPVIDSVVQQLRTGNDDTLRFWGGRQRGSEWNTRAFMLFSLANAAPERVDRAILAQAYANAGQMNAYAIAALGLAEHALGDDETARSLLKRLDARAIDDGVLAYWTGQTWDYAWEDDPVETTAYALRLEVALDPRNERIPRIIAFLRGQMRSGWAYTTKDTAAALYAMSEALPPATQELRPSETVQVAIDGRPIRTLKVTTPIIDPADAEVVIPAADIHDGSVVDIERNGRGALYWSVDAARYVPPAARSAIDKDAPLLERLFPPKPDVSIVRRYVTGRPGPWRIGEPVIVELEVSSRHDLQYVSIEDPFPAGVEHAIEQGAAGSDWSGLQFLDDRATFFATRMDAGRKLVLTYRLFPTTPGTFTAPAPVVSSMYGPPVKALGDAQSIIVTR